jgi:hypothetical protein
LSHVFVSFKIKKGGDALKGGDLKVTFTPNAVQLENQANGEVLVHLDVANEISPDESSYVCSTKKIELKMKKKLENINWIGLESGSATTRVEALQNTALPSYPSSAKVKRDFNAIDKELDKMLSKEGAEGDSALNGLFKQIYERSDENTRRAMIKSYQTSGGTVLSTNWQEVADKDYEGRDRPDAPDGQQWAK